jgi:fused signal recognition particle receptor
MPDGPGFVLLYVLVVLLVLALVGVGARAARRRTEGAEREAMTAPGRAPTVRAPEIATGAEPETVEPKTVEPRAMEPKAIELQAVELEETVAAPAAEPTLEALAPVEAPAVPPRPRPLRERLGRARAAFGQAVARVVRRGGLTDADWEELEALLLQADVGVAATRRILDELRLRARSLPPERMPEVLRDELVAVLGDADRSLRVRDGLTVWLVTGVNGTGKTTTIGKLAFRERARGRRVVLAAADTFRAAADEQLERWAARAGAEVVKHAPGADPAAVAYDGVQAARARGADLLIVDTAGRLHTKRNLMEELAKIRRVLEREAGPPDEVLLVIDATTGQNGIAQARAFTEAVSVTGIALTKLDGTAKGGIVIAVQQELEIPVKLVGVGEDPEDLEPFDPRAFVEALLA